MNYQEAIDYYNLSPKFLSVPATEGLKKLLCHLGNPQKKLDFIHIAGTNGKGSVSVMISEAYRLSGAKTGLFTSPYIEKFNERIKINGKDIPDEALISITERVKSAIDDLNIELTAFAKVTAAAFLYFAAEKCDIVVLECGLGGEHDSTNVIDTARLCVITKIGLDHTEYLGDTLAEIAAEKCGILKNPVPLVSVGTQDKTVLSVLSDFSLRIGSRLLLADGCYTGEIGLSGEYQKENASIAELCLKTLGVPNRFIQEGIKNCSWPVRFEFIKDNLILDGAHNPNGMEALLYSLSKLNRPIHFVVAVMQDKNYKLVAKMLRSFGGKITVTQIDMPRCLSANDLAKEFDNPTIIENPETAVLNALSAVSGNELVCVCGSLYLAGEIRKILK